MSDNIAADQLRLLIERVERLEEEKKGISDDIQDVYLEAKATGYDPKIMRQIVRLRKMPPLPPVPEPLLVDERGHAWVPHAFRQGFVTPRIVARGVGLAWWPVAEADGVILSMAAGHPGAPTEEMVVTFLSREGLRGFVRDLASIEAQLADEVQL
jgi:hypothetical protein